MRRIVRHIKRFIFGTFVKHNAKFTGANLKVNGFSKVSKNTSLGNNVNLNGLFIDGEGKVKIGNNFHSGKHCRIITNFHDYDHGDSIPYDSQRSILKEVIIEDNVWIGYGVIILGGIHIGEGSIIQAGSVVVKDIAPFSIAGGHPAIEFKKRDIAHYNLLKAEEKYF